MQIRTVIMAIDQYYRGKKTLILHVGCEVCRYGTRFSVSSWNMRPRFLWILQIWARFSVSVCMWGQVCRQNIVSGWILIMRSLNRISAESLVSPLWHPWMIQTYMLWNIKTANSYIVKWCQQKRKRHKQLYISVCSGVWGDPYDSAR